MTIAQHQSNAKSPAALFLIPTVTAYELQKSGFLVSIAMADGNAMPMAPKCIAVAKMPLAQFIAIFIAITKPVVPIVVVIAIIRSVAEMNASATGTYVDANLSGSWDGQRQNCGADQSEEESCHFILL
jgi:hypothetical protein